ELRAQASKAALPASASAEPAEQTQPSARVLPEILGPEQVVLKQPGGDGHDRRLSVMVSLTPDAIWIQDVWELRSIPLQALGDEIAPTGKRLSLALGDGVGSMTLKFAGRREAGRWCEQIQARKTQLSNVMPGDRYMPEGVSLVKKPPKIPYVE